MNWVKVGSVWIGIPDDGGTISKSRANGLSDRSGIRCYVIGVDSSKELIGSWVLKVVRDDGSAEEIDSEMDNPAEGIKRLQHHAEVHYRWSPDEGQAGQAGIPSLLTGSHPKP